VTLRILSKLKSSLCLSTKQWSHIQGDSGGKVDVVGGDNIGHFKEKKVHMNVCNSEWFLRYRCLNLSFNSVRFLCVVLDEE
jgi:hypothetical protein